MAKNIGLIAGGFKPFTIGHEYLVNKAASENDIVYLFVSTKDRSRPGEHSIAWSAMKDVWKLIMQAKNVIPKNVMVVFESKPTTAQLKVLEMAEETKKHEPWKESAMNTYTIYAGAEDIKRYDNPRIKEKTFPLLWSDGQLRFEPISRYLSTPGDDDSSEVSGTLARKALESKNMPEFIKLLPRGLQQHGHIVYDLLVVNEK